MPQLDICNLTHIYKKNRALNNVSATLGDGVVALVGPNGAGKSTMINIIVGLLQPTNGDVRFNGASIMSLGKQYYENVGYCPQASRFYPNFTVYEFLTYMGTLKKLPSKKLRQKVDELISLVNLNPQRNAKIYTLSGGMKQRLGIAQALLNNPSLLILDEPTAGLDPNERIRFRNLISQISSNRIVILATHIISDVESIANQVLLLRNGELIANGSPTNVLDGVNEYVWLIPQITHDELDKYSERYVVSNIRRSSSDCYDIKVISDVQPSVYAQLDPPSLEDAFLYHFRKMDG